MLNITTKNEKQTAIITDGNGNSETIEPINGVYFDSVELEDLALDNLALEMKAEYDEFQSKLDEVINYVNENHGIALESELDYAQIRSENQALELFNIPTVEHWTTTALKPRTDD